GCVRASVRYTTLWGSTGFFGADGNVDLSIVIRTAVLSGGVWTIGAGGAIVLDSDAEAEADEVELKASFLRRAIAQVAH
ncbi:MAG: chorismate-binding protein, partial [Canibacter sp.]